MTPIQVLDRMISEARTERGRSHELARTGEGKLQAHVIDAAAWAVRQKALEDARAAILKEATR